jgi:hypothetical protein
VPLGLSYRSVHDQVHQIYWFAPSGAVDGFNVYVRLNYWNANSERQKLATLKPNEQSIQFDLSAFTAWQFEVTAFNAAGESEPAVLKFSTARDPRSPREGAPDQPGLPSTPTVRGVVNAGAVQDYAQGGITVYWDYEDPSSSPPEWQVWSGVLGASNTKTAWSLVARLPGHARSWEDVTPLFDTTLVYAVFAVAPAGSPPLTPPGGFTTNFDPWQTAAGQAAAGMIVQIYSYNPTSGLAKGGVVVKPVVRQVGEAGTEAIVPVRKLRDHVRRQMQPQPGDGTSVEVVLEGGGFGSPATAMAAAAEIGRLIAELLDEG